MKRLLYPGAVDPLPKEERKKEKEELEIIEIDLLLKLKIVEGGSYTF